MFIVRCLLFMLEDFALFVIWCLMVLWFLMVFPKNDNEMRRIQSEIRYCQNYINNCKKRIEGYVKRIELLRVEYERLNKARILKYKKNSFRD